MKKAFGILMFVMLSLVESSAYAIDEGGVIALNPSPSPDGRHVVFSADYVSPDSQLHLWSANLDGSNLHHLPSPSNSKIDEEASWSVTNTIAFSSNDGAASNIWTMSPDGSRLVQLTSKSLNNHTPAWSSDGSKIAFVSDRSGTNDIWIMNADGTNQHQLTNLIGEENDPSFSPDGTQVVFSETANDNSSLWVINVNGTGLRQLTDNSFEDWHPSWGAKGIVFSSNRDGSGIHWFWIVNPDGTGLKKYGNVIGTDPIWTPSGNVVFSNETAQVDGAISVISSYDPTKGVSRIVVDREGFDAHISIRPFREPHEISLESFGKLRVAILSSKSFNAVTQVDPASIRFGHSGNEMSLYKCYGKGKDVNGDGIPDLICRFYINKTKLQTTDRIAKMRFHDVNGIPYEGFDSIHVVQKFDFFDKIKNYIDDDDNKDSD